MLIQEALTQIKKANSAPIYLVMGQEQYLMEQFVEGLMKLTFTSDEEKQMNSITYDMDVQPVDYVLDEADTIPFFGDNKLIFIKNPYFLTSEKPKNEMDHDIKRLMTYLEEPNPSTILVFLARYEKLDERKKIVKLLKKHSTLVDVSFMDERKLRHYVTEYLATEKVTIDIKAFERLLYLTDLNLSRIMQELDKLMLYDLERRHITYEAVDQLIPKSLEHNIFDMIDYVLKDKKEEALALYHELLIQGEDTIKINAILVNQFRLLLQIKLLQSIHYQQSNIVDVLKVHPYRVKLGMQNVKQHSLTFLGDALDELVENDVKIKTGAMEKELLFELFLLKQRF